MAIHFHTLGRRHLWFALCFVIVAAGLKYFLESQWWKRWDYDPAWAKANIAIAQGIIRSLVDFRRIHGRYPNELEELEPNHIKDIPSPVVGKVGGDRWWYELLPDGEYRLWVTAVHWASSYDALVYHSTQVYPKDWRHTNHCWDVGHWHYVVGFNDILRTGRVARFK